MYFLNRKIVLGLFLLVASNSVRANDVARGSKRDLISFSALDQLLAQDPPPTKAPTGPPVDNNGEDRPRTPPPTPPPTASPTTTPPTETPTGSGAPSVSNAPTSTPSKQPSSQPSGAPSATPSRLPSISPSKAPSAIPSSSPSAFPSKVPSFAPSSLPSLSPSGSPTVSSNPSVQGPTTSPSRNPTREPSSTPTLAPSAKPSVLPSDMPSTVPSSEPSSDPTNSPSSKPSSSPSSSPSSRPTNRPTSTPSHKPSMVPSNAPTTSRNPTNAPSRSPSPPPTRRPTMTPTFSPTSCPNPEVCLRFQTQGDTGFFAIDKCAASCDFDIQCKEGLVCYKRSRGQKNVPGCVGDADQIGTGDYNFCVEPPSNQLVLLGVNRSPSSAYPLRRCAGDCDNDNDCASGLFCFERNGLEAIPGCIGSGQNQFDYCYNPGSGFERLTFFGNLDYDYYELGQCEGDCDFDSDCEIGLVCYEREGGDNGRIPTCVGNANVIGFGNDDFCIPRPSSNFLISVYENEVGGDAASGGVFPIPRCAGDCDSDIDCLPGLSCYQRSGFNAVPGCSGTGEEDFDYCI